MAPTIANLTRGALPSALIWLWAAGCARSAGEEQPGSGGAGDFTLEQLVSIQSVTAEAVPDFAPDGSRLVFVGRDSLRVLPLQPGAPPEALPVRGASFPAYSPDGKWIGYVSDASGSPELWLWSVADRRAVQLTDLGARIGSWSWSPDSRRIALSSLLRGNYDVYTVAVDPSGRGAVRRLTSDGRYDVYPTWTPDSRTIVYVRMDERWVDHDVIAIDAETGAGARVVVRDQDFFDYRVGAEFGPAQVSPRGDMVLFRSHRSGWLNWWVVPLAGGQPRRLAPEAADQNSQKPFRGYARWSPDGRSVAFTSNLNGTNVLRIAPVEGAGDSVRTLVAPDLGVVANIAWSVDGRQIAYTLDTPTQPMHLYLVETGSGAVTRLTRSVPDSALLTRLFVPQKVRYPSGRLTIESYLFLPSTPAPPGGHPAIVWIHGGPTSQFDDSWGRHWPAHYFIKHGYAVLAPNIRGSSGYGLAFEKLSEGCWGRCDMEDVVAGVEYLRSRGDINADRVAATGTSYGGYMSIAAAVFAPGVFRAAVPTGSGYSDWIGAHEDFFALAEIKLLDFELGPLEQRREVYRRTSPLYYAHQVDTPMLLIGGEGDTPMQTFATQAARYYKPVRYLGYADVGGRDGRLEWMPEMLAFLDRHVKGSVELKPGREEMVASGRR